MQVWTRLLLGCACSVVACTAEDDGDAPSDTQLGEPISESNLETIEGEPQPEPGTSTESATTGERLCTRCASSSECGGGANLCLVRADGSRFCGRDCRTSPCPIGYSCMRLTQTVAQCVPPQADCSRVTDAGASADAGTPADAGTRSDAGTSGDVPNSAHCAAAATWDPNWISFEDEVFRLSNQRRQVGATCGTTSYPAAPPLTKAPALRCSARLHSKDMQDRAYFSHTTPDGVTFSQRITQAGYTWRTVGENIASGYRTPQAVVDGWMNSPGHCQNLMNPAFTQLGVGFYGNFVWTQNFGAPF